MKLSRFVPDLASRSNSAKPDQTGPRRLRVFSRKMICPFFLGSPQIHNIGACKSLQKEQGSILDFAPFLCSGACVAPSSFFMHLHAPILIGTVLRQNRAASVENEI